MSEAEGKEEGVRGGAWERRRESEERRGEEETRSFKILGSFQEDLW